MVMPSTPVKVKPMKLNPAALPRLSCRVPPISVISRKGKTKVPTMRVRSRRNLARSREAIAATALSSLTGQDPQVGVLEGWRLGSKQAQWRCQLADHLVRTATLQADLEDAVLLEAQVESPELFSQPIAVGRVDDQRLLQELGFDLLRGSQGHHVTAIHDADPVRLLGLLEVVRGQEQGGVVLPADLGQVGPEVSPAGRVEAGGRL